MWIEECNGTFFSAQPQSSDRSELNVDRAPNSNMKLYMLLRIFLRNLDYNDQLIDVNGLQHNRPR